MAKKMLIDATHPEETRVVVVDGQKVDDFDFESVNKKQLAGNIYLAKVTRVEPSLQAAFVDYGGNRHGFLAFAEIHPDYYQIPVADREALIAEEAALARESDSDDGDNGRPRRGKRRSDRDRARGEKRETKADSGASRAVADGDGSGDDGTGGPAPTGISGFDVIDPDAGSEPGDTDVAMPVDAGAGAGEGASANPEAPEATTAGALPDQGAPADQSSVSPNEDDSGDAAPGDASAVSDDAAPVDASTSADDADNDHAEAGEAVSSDTGSEGGEDAPPTATDDTTEDPATPAPPRSIAEAAGLGDDDEVVRGEVPPAKASAEESSQGSTEVASGETASGETASGETASGETTTEGAASNETVAETTAEPVVTADVSAPSSTEEAETPVEEKPKQRRRTRRRKADAVADEAAPTDTDGSTAAASSGDGAGPERVAETADSGSETVPEESAANTSDDGETADTADAAAPEAVSAADAGEAEEAGADDARGRNRRSRRGGRGRSRSKARAETEGESAEETAEAEAADRDGESEGDGEDSGGRRGRRRSRRRRKGDDDASDTVTAREGEDDETSESGDDEVDTVGAEDMREDELAARAIRRRRYNIQDVIKSRQIMLVQVVKEERGNKGAALTTYLSLAGRYCVLMPNTARGGGISRKITNAADRKRLREIVGELEVPEGMGLIVRTAGAERTRAEIKRDYEFLLRQWEQVRSMTLRSSAPCLIYEEGSLIKRAIRDLYNKDIDQVLVEGDGGYREAKDYMKMLMPSHAKNVQQYSDIAPLFIRFQVESYLNAMFSPTVQLKSGGYIVIGVTEALVAIDVNSGRSTREGSIEDTATKTNLEAADEVARQLRLRDLAGLIVIDFIDMDESRNNRAVEKRMKDRLKSDRARIQVGRISAFGLMEMSRQRLRPGMLEATTRPCPHCHGQGFIRSNESMALSILREIEEEGVRGRSAEVTAHLPVDVANYIINWKRPHLTQIEGRYGIAVQLIGDPALVSPEYRIEKSKQAQRAPIMVEAAVTASSVANAVDVDDAEILEDESDADEITARDAEDEGDRDGDADGRGRDTGDAGNRKRRRGKRGGRRRRNGEDGDGDDNGATDAEADTDDANDDEPSADGPSGGERSRGRRRSRGKSRRGDDADAPAGSEVATGADGEAVTETEAATASADPEPATGASDQTAVAALGEVGVADAASEVVAEEAPEAMTAAEGEPGGSVTTKDTPAAHAEAAAPSVEQASAASDNAAEAPREPEEGTLAEAEAEAEVAPDPEPEPEPEPDRPKRRGWWSLRR
ncbi:MAG: Rne/Rng family ribonuclease [Pseudomonadota bacterium]